MSEQEKIGGKWVDVAAQVKELREETWNTYWAEMTADESMEFLRDPKSALVEAGLIDEGYRVEAHVVNSDVAAVSDPVCKVLMVFPREKLALLTMYRHPPTS